MSVGAVLVIEHLGRGAVLGKQQFTQDDSEQVLRLQDLGRSQPLENLELLAGLFAVVVVDLVFPVVGHRLVPTAVALEDIVDRRAADESDHQYDHHDRHDLFVILPEPFD
jgi:hypothetical protein